MGVLSFELRHYSIIVETESYLVKSDKSSQVIKPEEQIEQIHFRLHATLYISTRSMRLTAAYLRVKKILTKLLIRAAEPLEELDLIG